MLLTNEELVALIQAGTDVTENLGLLYQQNLPMIDKFVTPLANVVRSSAVIDKADLMQEAYFGLVKAANEYDPTKGALFISFAELHIKTALRESKENFFGSKRIPAHMVEMISKYHGFRNKVISESGIEPTQKEIMVALNIKKPKLDAIEKAIHGMYHSSIDDFIPGTEQTIAETVQDGFNLEDTVVESLVEEQHKKIIWKTVDELPEKKKEIIIDHFKHQKTLEEIAEKNKCSVANIAKLQTKAFKDLSHKKVLWVIYEERFGFDSNFDPNCNYHFTLRKCRDTRSSSTEFVAINKVDIEKRKKKEKQKLDSFDFSEEGLKRLKEQLDERMKNLNASLEALERLVKNNEPKH